MNLWCTEFYELCLEELGTIDDVVARILKNTLSKVDLRSHNCLPNPSRFPILLFFPPTKSEKDSFAHTVELACTGLV